MTFLRPHLQNRGRAPMASDVILHTWLLFIGMYYQAVNLFLSYKLTKLTFENQSESMFNICLLPNYPLPGKV